MLKGPYQTTSQNQKQQGTRTDTKRIWWSFAIATRGSLIGFAVALVDSRFLSFFSALDFGFVVGTGGSGTVGGGPGG